MIKLSKRKIFTQFNPFLSCIDNVQKYYEKIEIAVKEKQQLLQTQIDQKIVEELLKFS